MMTDRVILICTVIIAAVYLYATTLIPTLEIGDPLGPKAFPRLIGGALLVAAAMLAVEMWRERGKSAGEAPFEAPVVKVLAVVAVWTGVYYATFESLGYIVSTTLFLLPMMAWFNRDKWVANIVSAVAFAAATYWLFVTLDVRLPRGFLPF